MAKNLDELKDDLYEMFNQAKATAIKGKDWDPRYPEQVKAVAAAIHSAAKTAESISRVEHEIAERDGIKSRPKLPGSTS